MSDHPKSGLKIVQVLAAWKSILGGSTPMLSIEVTRECPLSCPGCYVQLLPILDSSCVRCMDLFRWTRNSPTGLPLSP